MIYRVVLSICLIAASCSLAAQQKGGYTAPDYKKIEKVTKDKNSINYYPKLLSRYTGGDTTITVSEMEMLYYGWFFCDSVAFMGISTGGSRDSINAIHKRGVATNEDRRQLIKYYKEELSSAPFKLGTINALANLYEKLGDPKAEVYIHNLRMLCNLILSTGDGLTLKSGFHVNNISDEYSLLSVLGLEFGGEQSLISDCDYLKVAENDQHIKGIYFNVAQILLQESKALGFDKLELPSKKRK